MFLDAGADTDRSVPYILPEFPMIWETPFSVTDATFPCSVDRISGPLATEDHMYMINHSLNKNLLDTGIIVSDPLDAKTTNGVASSVLLFLPGEQKRNCVADLFWEYFAESWPMLRAARASLRAARPTSCCSTL